MNNSTTAGLRTSGSNPSLKPISNRTGSTRSTSSHLGSLRHVLLRSTSQRLQSMEKDVPVPPVLTRNNPILIDKGAAQNSGLQNSGSQTPTLVEKTAHSVGPAAPDPPGADTVDAAKQEISHSSVDYYGQFHSQHSPVSKVRPAVYDDEGGKSNPEDEHLSANPMLSEEVHPVEVHSRHNHTNTPKVRPFMESPSEEAPQLPEARRTVEEVPASNLAHQTNIHDNDDESRKMASQPHLGGQQQDRQPTPSSNGESSYPSQVNSQRSLKSPKQENLRQRHETDKTDLGATKVDSESQNVPGSVEEGSGRSIAPVPPTSPSSSASGSLNKGQKAPPQNLNTRRTARWLRGLLGFSEKTSPPQEPCDDADSIASKVTTFSCENMSLENNITEALSLANKAGQRQYGHVDDDSTNTPSIDESIRRDSSEYGGVTFVGHNVDNGGEALPLGSAKRPGLIKAVKRDGKVTRPHFLKRIRKSTSKTKNSRHTVDDGCILPMPPRELAVESDCVFAGVGADDRTITTKSCSGEVPNSREVRTYIQNFHEPPICGRDSSKIPYEEEESTCDDSDQGPRNRLSEIRLQDVSVCSLDGGTSDEVIEFSTQHSTGEKRFLDFLKVPKASGRVKDEKPAKDPKKPRRKPVTPTKHTHGLRNVSLRNRSHVSIGSGQRFSLTRSARRQPTIARDYTALIGVLIGIYAGLVPSIQYYIADFHHYAILGNVGLYLGMALPNFFCWPLPLLHGRKPYIVGGLCVAMPLLFPQALAIGTRRSPNTCVWRVALLLPRALMGLVLGFANMNFHSVLTDLFGASLMSKNPHQEVVDEYDVRRHGGGLGVWLGIWTWCFIGSLGVGFVVGAVVIEYLQPSWGLYISIVIIAVVLLLNVLCPEVRRSAWRRSVAEVRMGETISRRLARGEVMMHRVQTGPRWWGQEVYHGVALSLEMLRQPGFTIMAVYSAWIYAQIVLVIVLLGSLTSKSYRLRSPYVGAVVSSVAIGALAAIPFQKANLFSRARNMSPKSNTMTFDRKITWSSRLVRRSIFTLVLPITGIIYTVVSTGPPVHVFLPSLFAALIGFLSCLAISECNGMMMEAWDCSDLQPGMTGRSTSSKDSHKRTNYSSFPRVTAGWNFIQGLGFIFAAGATALGGSVTRQLGQRAATGVVAGILFILTLLLLCTLIRFKRVQIIPDCTCSEMDRWNKERRVSLHNWAAAMAEAKEKGTQELNQIPEDDVG
ncbi:hypothetical protein GGS24DRAFT_489151 [Hypoxylon argillaceum]|nr:hypothetical protein GGS24DRAFT_489151 [Hypoxylon argillaceum]